MLIRVSNVVANRGACAGRYGHREKTDGLERIVRDWQGSDLEPVDAHRHIHRQRCDGYVHECWRLRRAVGREHRPSPTPDATREPADVVAVIMSEETRIDRRGIDRGRLEAIGERARPEPRVDQNACSIALKKNGVPATASPENPDLHSLLSTIHRARCAADSCSRPRFESVT